MKVFVSHKDVDSDKAMGIVSTLKLFGVDAYLDKLKSAVFSDGKELTEHIKRNLNNCTDILVLMSNATRFSQWVPFEIGMAAQKDMPTVTYLIDNVILPEYLDYWPCLRSRNDLATYVSVREQVCEEIRRLPTNRGFTKDKTIRGETEIFYRELKRHLRK